MAKNVYIRIAIDHILANNRFEWTGINVLHFVTSSDSRRGNVFDAHLDKSTKSAQIATANETKKWPSVESLFLRGESNTEFIQQLRQTRIQIANDLGKNLVHWLKNKLDETALGRTVGWFASKFPRLAVKINVAPQATGQFILIDILAVPAIKKE